MKKLTTATRNSITNNHRKKVRMDNSRRVLVRMEPALFNNLKRIARDTRTSLQAAAITAIRDLAE